VAQTTGALSWIDAVMEVSTDGISYYDVSGSSNAVKVDGGERAISEFFTANGDTPILTRGKRSKLEVTFAGVYTEVTGELFDRMIGVYEAATTMYFRWSVKTHGTGVFIFSTSAGYLTKPVYPQGASDSADAVQIEATISVASIAKSIHA
jgi:hypothetical protein